MKRAAAIVLLVLACAGCATYRSLPLAANAQAPHDPADVRVDAATMPFATLRRHVFDPAHGLDMTDVAMLAVANNPQLKLARDERGVAHAQAFAAGLLPDPVLDFARGFPTGGPAETSSYDAGLSYDLTALLTHALDKRAARASARQVDLDLLWQEWQVVGAARQLFARGVYQARMLDLLRDEVRQHEKQHVALLHAYVGGDVTMAALGLDQAGLQAAQTRRDEMARQLLTTRAALDKLLGLSPDARLDLVGPATLPVISQTDVEHALATLAQRRPDLLALQAGYESQDARYRRAIWQQFPAIDIGFVQARDSDAIRTRGFRVSITLPVFNRNRGNIAIEKATRQTLHDEYTLRLVRARDDITRIMQDQALLAQQQAELSKSVAAQEQTLHRLDATAMPGDVSQTRRLGLVEGENEQGLKLLDVELATLEQQAALQVLLGRLDTD